MCRFTLYLGPRISLNALLIEPEHSLIRQSARSLEREEPLNGDGFGVGWYAAELDDEPAVFRSITPAWNNRNLHNLARVVASNCIFAHVRAATQSSGVNEANCHPFRYGKLLFMHNGDVGNFRMVRRQMLAGVSDAAFGNVFGSTDSEHLFAIFIDEFESLPASGRTIERMASAMSRTIARAIDIVARHGDGMACHLNCCVSDGVNAVVSRFANDPDEAAPTLYYTTGHHYRELSGDSEQEESPIIVSSERLTPESHWQIIPPNHLILAQRGRLPEIRMLDPLMATAHRSAETRDEQRLPARTPQRETA